MLDLRNLEITLRDQALELSKKDLSKFCPRMEEELVDLESPLAQVVVGVRRCGKSTMCHSLLAKAGVNFAYVNFDDDRLAMVNVDDLNSILEVLHKIHGEFTHIFFDEIQNVDGWQLFVNRLLRQGYKLLITGSNAKLLSKELATHLTGRHHEITLYPFSFSEFCRCSAEGDISDMSTEGIARRRALFDVYMHNGGFPELMNLKRPQDYVSDLVDNILKRDIEERFRINLPREFEDLAYHLMNIVPSILSPQKLADGLGIKSPTTVRMYAGYLGEAFLLSSLHKYSAKSKHRLTGTKAYPIDVAIMDKRPDAFKGENLGWRLEAIVYLELRRRCHREGLDLYYLREGRSECDFLICRGNKAVEAIQVAYDISSPKTLRREINGLKFAAAATKCEKLTLITDYAYDNISEEGLEIRVRPAHEWVL